MIGCRNEHVKVFKKSCHDSMNCIFLHSLSSPSPFASLDKNTFKELNFNYRRARSSRTRKMIYSRGIEIEPGKGNCRCLRINFIASSPIVDSSSSSVLLIYCTRQITQLVSSERRKKIALIMLMMAARTRKCLGMKSCWMLKRLPIRALLGEKPKQNLISALITLQMFFSNLLHSSRHVESR
jgi:hypothetical protein